MRTVFVVPLLVLAIGTDGQAKEPKLWATLTGHKGAVNAVAFAPSQAVLASASDDGMVKLWNLDTGENTVTFVHPAPVLSVAFDEAGSRLVSGCRDGTVRVWSLVTGKETATIQAELPARHVWFSGENQVGVTYPAEIKAMDAHDFWDLSSGEKVPLVINCSTLNLDVSAGRDNGWAIANVEPHYPDQPITTGEISFTPRPKGGTAQFPIALRGHTGKVTCLAFTPKDGKWLISGSLDKTIKIWIPETAICVATLRSHTGAVRCVTISEDGKTLVSGSADATIKLWDLSR
jgi:WD40 repeat protein